MQNTGDDQDYICTHIYDFKVVSKNPQMWIDKMVFVFLVKEYGSRNYYLSNDYIFHETHDMWTYGCNIYATDAVARVERQFGFLPKVLRIYQSLTTT